MWCAKWDIIAVSSGFCRWPNFFVHGPIVRNRDWWDCGGTLEYRIKLRLDAEMDEITLKHLGPGDTDWLVDMHGRLYADAEGFDDSFGRLVRDILNDFEADHDPTCERAFIAWEGDLRLGSIFCVRLSDDTAKLRLFLLAPEARGKGLGRHMLDVCMAYARQSGYRRMELWTHKSHKAACALYEKTGWTMMKEQPVVSFGQNLIEQSWQVEL